MNSFGTLNRNREHQKRWGLAAKSFVAATKITDLKFDDAYAIALEPNEDDLPSNDHYIWKSIVVQARLMSVAMGDVVRIRVGDSYDLLTGRCDPSADPGKGSVNLSLPRLQQAQFKPIDQPIYTKEGLNKMISDSQRNARLNYDIKQLSDPDVHKANPPQERQPDDLSQSHVPRLGSGVHEKNPLHETKSDNQKPRQESPCFKKEISELEEAATRSAPLKLGAAVQSELFKEEVTELKEAAKGKLSASSSSSSSLPTLEEVLLLPRQMCIKLQLDKPVPEITPKDAAKLKAAVARHGTICLVAREEDRQLSPIDLKQFAGMWGDLITLPPGLAFNNQNPEHPEVAHVGNVLVDGTLVTKHSAAEYWHHDGDFWAPGQHQILNFLYACQVPSKGGNTGFLDTRKAYLELSDEDRNKLQGAYSTIHASEITDFKNLPPEERPADVEHSVFQTHPATGEISLYLPASSTGIRAADGTFICNSSEYVEATAAKDTFEYVWTSGDMLIWDNTTTMHRSMGGYFDEPRALIRVQARI